MNAEELKKVLQAHKKWPEDNEKGERADLRGANLRGADLQGANLCDCDFNNAVITFRRKKVKITFEIIK